jgi:hypothetical protein
MVCPFSFVGDFKNIFSEESYIFTGFMNFLWSLF